MSQPGFPVFLAVQIPAPIPADRYLSAAAAAVAGQGGTVLAAAAAGQVECLEAGTPAAAILLAEFPDLDTVRACWTSAAHRAAWAGFAGQSGIVAVAVNGLPYEGLPEAPEIPSTASVTPPPGRGPRSYMLIQGTATDQVRMDQYRDIILPMIAAQGAYYVCFEIEGQVERLAGDWTHNIFAISRWPDHAAGHAFWDSERYQKTAIPIRTGAGHFLVHFLTGLAG